MLHPYASNFLFLLQWLDLARQVNIVESQGKTPDEQKKSFFAEIAFLASERLEGADLPISKIHCKRIMNDLILDGQFDLAKVRSQFQELRQRIEDELRSMQFYQVKANYIDFYNKNQFPAQVINQFNSAIYDMEEAGKCLALGRYTASVFHTMRVVEHGLKRVAHCYSLPEVKSWGTFLTLLREYAVNNKNREKGIMTLHAKIGAIKSAWRDDTMHVVRSYDDKEAENILNAVKNFMEDITGNLP